MATRPWFCPWNVFFSQSEQAFNHQRIHSQINAYSRPLDTHKVPCWARVRFFFISCDFELDLIMNGDFRPLFCPWNVFFSQSEQAFKPSDPTSQINAYS
jgi:hypothetical protein